MRTRAEIRQQLKQVTYRHLQKLLRANFKQKPSSCCHNQREDIDALGNFVFVCGFESPDGTPRNVICDQRIEGCQAMARECGLWSPLKTKEEVKADFHEIVQSGNRGLIASHFPDIAALMWVLDDAEGVEVPPEEEVNHVVEQDGPMKPPSEGWSPTSQGGS